MTRKKILCVLNTLEIIHFANVLGQYSRFAVPDIVFIWTAGKTLSE